MAYLSRHLKAFDASLEGIACRACPCTVSHKNLNTRLISLFTCRCGSKTGLIRDLVSCSTSHFSNTAFPWRRGLKVLPNGTLVPVAAKQLIGAQYVRTAEREAAILNDVSGRWYTVEFYGLVKDPPFSSSTNGGESDADCTAWLITG